MKFENIDLVDTLRRIMDIHTQNYKEDFELDAGLLHSLAGSQSPEDKHLLWMSRPNGTYLLPEREVYVEDSYENKVWEFYHEQTRDPILAYKEIDGHTFWLMEHDTFGDDASCIIVDERGELVLSHIYDGFDETAVNLLRQEVMPVEKMPDDSISIEEMKQYGYKWGGMLPMREEAAAEVMKSCQIYRLYSDDTEGLVLDAKEIKEHAAKGGIFGVEKADWVAELEKQNPLKAAEMSLEDDYGMIDGIINNGPKEDKASEKGGKASIMDRLKSAKTAQQTDKPSPHKEKKSEREL